MTPERHQRILAMLNKRQPDLTVCMEGVHKTHNLSAVVRTCDAIGVSDVHAVWKNETMRVGGGSAAGSQQWVDVHDYNNVSDAIDVLKATFPAGTVSGAPKIRAMEIIHELEPIKRGVYSGAVGYLGWNGNMDTAIAIRTAVIKDGKINVQAGAGIVADSVPKYEWKETLNKARAMVAAVEMATSGLGFGTQSGVKNTSGKN